MVIVSPMRRSVKLRVNFHQSLSMHKYAQIAQTEDFLFYKYKKFQKVGASK